MKGHRRRHPCLGRRIEGVSVELQHVFFGFKYGTQVPLQPGSLPGKSYWKPGFGI